MAQRNRDIRRVDAADCREYAGVRYVPVSVVFTSFGATAVSRVRIARGNRERLISLSEAEARSPKEWLEFLAALTGIPMRVLAMAMREEGRQFAWAEPAPIRRRES